MIDLSSFVSSLESKYIYVYGLGKSGLSCVEALLAANASVFAWDGNQDHRKQAEALGVTLVDEQDADYTQIKYLLLSPGIPLTHPKPHSVVLKAQQHDIEIIGDIEVFGRVLPAGIKTIGITGTNGKSTTTALIGHILNECGITAEVGGNIGTPVLSLNLKKNVQAIVLEMSSYQIDLCPSFTPDVGVLLNITPDHLDRHGTMTNYAQVKAKIFGLETKPIISIDDDYSRAIAKKLADQNPIKVSTQERSKADVKVSDFNQDEEADVVIESLGDLMRFPCLAGIHNHQNALMALCVCREMGLEDDDIFDAMETFPGLAHRQQIVAEKGGIMFVNDSKATNAEAAAKALGTYEDIFWICGGQAKEGGLNGLEGLMPRVEKTYLIGEAANDFAQWLEKEKVPNDIVNTLEKAVSEAYQDAKKHERPCVVLLSPACASWDQFKSFEHRGEMFQKYVSGLRE